MTIVDDHCDNCSLSFLLVTSLMLIPFNFKILLANMAYGTKDAPYLPQYKVLRNDDALKSENSNLCFAKIFHMLS